MGIVAPFEKEMNAQRKNWHALHQVAQWQHLGKAVARAEWISAGEPLIDGEWVMRGSQTAARVMNDSIKMHGSPPDLEEMAQAKRDGKLDQLIAEANAKFAESRRRQSF